MIQIVITQVLAKDMAAGPAKLASGPSELELAHVVMDGCYICCCVV